LFTLCYVCCVLIATERKRIKPVDAAMTAIANCTDCADGSSYEKEFISDDIGE